MRRGSLQYPLRSSETQHIGTAVPRNVYSIFLLLKAPAYKAESFTVSSIAPARAEFTTNGQ